MSKNNSAAITVHSVDLKPDESVRVCWRDPSNSCPGIKSYWRKTWTSDESVELIGIPKDAPNLTCENYCEYDQRLGE